MNQRERGIYSILKTALPLFRTAGFDCTSVRMIAQGAGNTPAMINHYFGSKECLGAQVMDLISSYVTAKIPDVVSYDEDPVLSDLLWNRMMFTWLNENGYGNLYKDSLKNDFFFNFMDSHPTHLIGALSKAYGFSYTEDEAVLYGLYLPYMMEKTLILKKEEGKLSSIPYDSVPYYIASSAMSHFIPEEEIGKRNQKSIELCRELMLQLDDQIPDELIEKFAEEYSRKTK